MRIDVSVRNAYSGTLRFSGAGPLRMRPDVSYCEPWHGQYQPPNSPRGSDAFWPSGTQPRCVQTPTRISHSGFWTRDASVWGSRKPDGLSVTLPAASTTGSAFLADAISSGVRW